MWRYLVGAHRGRSQWNGVIRPSPQSVCKDEIDSELSKANTERNLSARCYHEGNRERRRDSFRGQAYCRLHHLHFNSLPKFVEAFFLSTSFLFSLQVSHLWKYYHEDERRRREFVVLEHSVRFLQLRSHAVDGVIPKQHDVTATHPLPDHAGVSAIFVADKSCLKPETEQKPLRRIRTSSWNDLIWKKVRFAEEEGKGEGQGDEADSVSTLPESFCEQFYAEFETSWKELCQQYDKMRCNKKGVVALERNGDLDSAITHFRKAGGAGCARAQFNLGLLYQTGSGVNRNLDMAEECYRLAAELGSLEAAHNLALIYLTSRRPALHESARELLQTAASGGLKQAKTELGALCAEEGDYVKAIALFEEAAKDQDADAMFLLGTCYEHAHGTQRDTCRAAELYACASRAGHAQAQCRLAYFYEHGIGGLPRDVCRAVDLYEQSARAGNRHALSRLNTLTYTWSQDEGGGLYSLRASLSAPSLLSHLLAASHAHWKHAPLIPPLSKSQTYSGQLSETKAKVDQRSAEKATVKINENFQNDKEMLVCKIQKIREDHQKSVVETGQFGLDINNFVDYKKTVIKSDIKNKPTEVVSDKKDTNKVLFRLGEGGDANDSDSLSWYSSESSPTDFANGFVLDGGFGSFTATGNLSKTKAGKKSNRMKKSQKTENLSLDGGFGIFAHNLSKGEGGLERVESKDSVLSVSTSASDVSISFDDTCEHSGLVSLIG